MSEWNIRWARKYLVNYCTLLTTLPSTVCLFVCFFCGNHVFAAHGPVSKTGIAGLRAQQRRSDDVLAHPHQARADFSTRSTGHTFFFSFFSFSIPIVRCPVNQIIRSNKHD